MESKVARPFGIEYLEVMEPIDDLGCGSGGQAVASTYTPTYTDDRHTDNLRDDDEFPILPAGTL